MIDSSPSMIPSNETIFADKISKFSHTKLGLIWKIPLRSCMKNKSFEIFMASIKSPVSKKVYTYSLNEFMKFDNIKNYDDILKFNTKKIQKLLQNWVMALSEKQLTSQTILSKLHAIEGFLDMN